MATLQEGMPHAAIVTVGDELLCGDIANANGTWLARELEGLGVRVRIIATLPDDRESIASFVRWARTDNDVVVVTGGLGTTPDDVTRDSVADAFGVERALDEGLAAELTEAGGHAAAFASEWCSSISSVGTRTCRSARIRGSARRAARWSSSCARQPRRR